MKISLKTMLKHKLLEERWKNSPNFYRYGKYRFQYNDENGWYMIKNAKELFRSDSLWEFSTAIFNWQRRFTEKHRAKRLEKLRIKNEQATVNS